MRISSIISLMRPQQYVKNLFIYIPLFFATKITDTGLLLNASIAFFAFSITSSAVYILNDYFDIEADRQHPIKKNRPLVTGDITKPHAIIFMVLLFLVGIVIMNTVSIAAVSILLAYITMNLAYSFRLKHVAILDVIIIAIGFVLRLFVGSAATDVVLSMWIVIMTFLLALFMALAKRRDDVVIYLETGKKIRKAIDGYNLQFLDTAMSIMASVVIVAYIIYTTSIDVIARVHSEYLYLTALFVIMGIMRYLQIAFVDKDCGSPTKIILTDRFMQLTLLAWIGTFTWILY